MFKKTLLAGAVAAAVMPFAASAADSPHTFTGNVGIYSQYIFRGLTQTNGEPAIQGGFDYSHASGFYAGTWASNISWLRDNASYSAGGSGEFDFYGGYKGTIGKSDFGYDLGTLYYYYPGDVNVVANPLNVKGDTWEIYGALSYKWVSAKFSYAVSNKVFGVREADGTYYFDLTATYPVSKELSLIAHYGIQKFTGQDPRAIGAGPGGTNISNDDACSYNDWKVGLSYALPKDFTIGAYYTDTGSVNNFCYGAVTDVPAGAYPKNIAKGTGTVFISKTF